jgi:ubiquinone/menaquinone biosynthesis C-methylase UbiE
MSKVILIVYTTRYKKGGDLFERVAHTMAEEKKKIGMEVVCVPTETKSELKALFTTLSENKQAIAEFHFVGHSGMYGPMFGTIAYPEQFSPYEIRILRIPFGEQASAYFHCCRSARWFAPFFARSQRVTTYGYHWYTAFSAEPQRYKMVWSGTSRDAALYCFGCPGKKSHGLLASVKKYSGSMKAEVMKKFSVEDAAIDTSYNPVAALYHETFSDITVRRDEYRWIKKHFRGDGSQTVLDVGCGNGALLRELHDQIKEGVGVDVSEDLLSWARKYNQEINNLKFIRINGPELPFDDHSFDVVISMLSFRYLDWDPIMKEIERILKKEGKLIVLDMVTAPVRWRELPQFLNDKLVGYYRRLRDRSFHDRLKKLVTDPAWHKMLQYNPIRSEHEMKWYLESRFPGRKVEVINIGYNSRILAFDSVNMENLANINLTYP